jgi:hypothetical protein
MTVTYRNKWKIGLKGRETGVHTLSKNVGFSFIFQELDLQREKGTCRGPKNLELPMNFTAIWHSPLGVRELSGVFDMYMSYRPVISYDLAHRTYTVPSS